MSGLVMSVGLQGRPPNRHEARAMADAAKYRSLAGTREAHVGSAAAIFLDGGEEDATRSSILATHDGLLLVADARIDNRLDLAAQLDIPARDVVPDDGVLLLEAYRRWGEAFADQLIGDFSIVVWDSAARRLIAARDRQAMRPLHYRADNHRILVASDVRQILAAGEVSADPREERIAAMLAGIPGLPDWTFYSAVSRLPPGHCLVVGEQGVRVTPLAASAVGNPTGRSIGEYAAALRTHLNEAVRSRLEGATSAGLMLSGGLDSTSIAGVAGLLRASGATPVLRTYSFAYADLPQCDERDVSDIVTRHYGLPNTLVPAADAWPLAGHPDHGPDIDGPDRFQSHVVMDRSLAIAREDGVRILMTGQRGDSLMGDNVVDHLGRLRDDGPRAFWRDLTAHGTRTGRSLPMVVERYLLRRLLTRLWPRERASRSRARLRRVLGLGRDEFPSWLRRETIRRFNLDEVARQLIPRSALGGDARRRRYVRMADPQLLRNAEAMERKFARMGIRHVDPWSDIRLAKLVLEMPQYVIAPAGEPKWLLREAMRGVVPEEARRSARKRTPGASYDRGLFEREVDVVLSLIEGSRAASRGYIDEKVLRSAYFRFRADPHRVTERERRHLWRFIDLEDWLRRFHN